MYKYEIEFRGMFNSQKFKELKKYLDKNAENLGPDNKDCYFHVFSDKLLKVVKNVSKKNAKVSLKLNRIGEGSSFPEIEFCFDMKDFEKAVTLFENLSLPAKIIHESQERTNYRYKGCEIALKYSKSWGHHIEIEKVVDLEKKQKEAEKAIRELAKELDVRLMTERDLKNFIREREKNT